ncbi:MAG: transcription elongation factor GreA [Chloroflexi bacterium]|nr:transcription elongation factor GreA [Chloroflexota bacterium]
MNDEVVLTAEGAKGLRRELDELITTRRPELARRLKEAVEDGDLKENANYHDTKEQLGFTEGRIKYLQDVLLRAQIATNDGPNDVVRVGAEVTIQEVGSDVDEIYLIVGAAESNPREGKLSAKSPIGAALMGHKRGDKVKVTAPGGEISFKIKKVK